MGSSKEEDVCFLLWGCVCVCVLKRALLLVPPWGSSVHSPGNSCRQDFLFSTGNKMAEHGRPGTMLWKSATTQVRGWGACESLSEEVNGARPFLISSDWNAFTAYLTLFYWGFLFIPLKWSHLHKKLSVNVFFFNSMQSNSWLFFGE